MDLSLFLIIGIIILLLAALGLMALIFSGAKKLSPAFTQKVKEHMQKIATLSQRDQILEYDKILSLCLKELGYEGTLAEKMKAYGQEFKDTHAIWTAHKLRNKIAHEIDFEPSKKEYNLGIKAFRREIQFILSS